MTGHTTISGSVTVSGTVNATGHSGGEGGDVHIGGGNITIKLQGDVKSETKNEAIGAGHSDGKSGSLYISESVNNTGKNMRVAYLPDGEKTVKTASAGERSKKAHTNCTLYITECDHKDYNGVSGLTYTVNGDKHTKKCKYCGLDVTEDHRGSDCECDHKSDSVMIDTTPDTDLNVSYGTVAADKTAAEAGETVTLTVAPNEGYRLDRICCRTSEGADEPEMTKVSDTTYTFTMPAEDVVVSILYQKEEFIITETGDGV